MMNNDGDDEEEGGGGGGIKRDREREGFCMRIKGKKRRIILIRLIYRMKQQSSFV